MAKLAARYSEDAEAYEELWAPELRPLGRQLIELLRLDNPRRVLDLGAGVGALVPPLRELFPSATLVAGDRAEGMIGRASPEAARLVLDARHLPFADSGFDAAVLAFVLFHIPQPVSALKEVRRVLAPGGSIGVGTWGDQRPRAALLVWSEELDRHGADDFVPMADHDLTDTPEKVAVLLEDAGFRDARTITVRSERPVSLEEFIALRTRIGASAARLRSLDEETRAACLSSAIARIEPMDPREYIDDQDALLTTARAV